jgi:1-pyrroline-5-carboxylate dehydrogenase
MSFKITYSVLNADLTELHNAFEKALAQVRGGLGKEYPCWIGGKAHTTGKFLEDRNPAKNSELLGRFHTLSEKEVDSVVTTALAAQKSWGHKPWRERAALIRKAADLISERKLELSAIMCLETGKNRLESLGDVEESADLFRYYATQLEENNGYHRPLGKLSPNEDTRSVLRPYGVFAVISPFNFPLALAAGMSGAALLGGNSVIIKPSSETPWCAHKLFECLRDAGLPEGVFQVVYGGGGSLGEALVTHPQIAGLAFTGSKEIGMHLMKSISVNYAKPALLELGGKNATIVCAKADVDAAAEGCMRSAFGLTGQKCSALSRVYLHKTVAEDFLRKLVEKTRALKIGDPALRDTYVGPLINAKARNRHMTALEEARKTGQVLVGGEDLKSKPEFSDGHFVAPVVARLPRGHRLFQDELFSPFLSVDTFDNLEEAVTEANRCDYGLTAGVFSQDPKDVEYFMDHIEAGVLYSNRKTGATTGAWPGVQSFCGWKGSGSTGKGGCGPYYVSQFMREQSQTRMGQ